MYRKRIDVLFVGRNRRSSSEPPSLSSRQNINACMNIMFYWSIAPQNANDHFTPAHQTHSTLVWSTMDSPFQWSSLFSFQSHSLFSFFIHWVSLKLLWIVNLHHQQQDQTFKRKRKSLTKRETNELKINK